MKLIDTGTATAERNMAIDQELLLSLADASEPILHLYDWEGPCATYGHFAHPESLFNVQGAIDLGYSLAKRPTGGGVIFHTTDYAFSVLVPATYPYYSENTLDNYQLVNRKIGEVIKKFSDDRLHPTFEPCPSSQERPSFCMAKPTCFDLVIEGKKVVGAAQRRTRHGFLHQGSISLALPAHLERLVSPPTEAQMRKNSFFLLEGYASIQQARIQLHRLIKEIFLNNKLQ